MQAHHPIHHIELILLVLVAFVASLTALAQRLKIPYPILLVLGGLLLSLIPVVPDVSLNPALIFLVVLPPLLYASALQTSWREFRANIVTIFLLAFGLVGFTVAGVAFGARVFFHDFDLASGAVLGAVVSATDVIAAATIARRLGLPSSLLEIIEGESMVNDASGLVALQLSTAIVVSGEAPSISGAAGELLLLVFGGIAAGLLVGKLVTIIQRPIGGSAEQTLISIATPYVAYLLAESVHASGVMATICCGLYIGHRSSREYTSELRVDSRAVWSTIEFALNGFVFIVVGLQLPTVLELAHPTHWRRLIAGALFIGALLLVLRMLWIYPVARLSHWLHQHRIGRHALQVTKPQAFVVGWSGMRGVLTLAAALSLPEVTDLGAPFPHRPAIIFLAFASIVFSLVFQGLTLPGIIRRLGVCATPGMLEEERYARRTLISSALRTLEGLRGQSLEQAEVTSDLIERYYRERLRALEEEAGEAMDARRQLKLYGQLSSQLRSVERSELLRLQHEGKIGGETHRRLERELDLLDLRWPSE